MSKKRILLTLILSLGSTGAIQANPLDSPGIVYIDGEPCNSACQSYMAWSAQALSGRYREQHETNVAAPAEAEPEHAVPARVARQPARVSRAAPRAAVAVSKTGTSNTRKTAAPNPPAARKDVQAASAPAAGAKPITRSLAPESKPEGTSKPEPGQAAVAALPQSVEAPKETVQESVKESVKETATPEVVLPPPATLEIAPPATAAATSSESPAPAPRTIQQQVVEATGLADFVTAIGTGQAPADKSANPETATGETKDAGKAAAASPEDADNLVALVLARPEINSLSDLNNRNIAIEEKQSASSGRVSAAFMAAGAAEVQFSEGQQGAVDRLIRGEVPAAVLTLASPQAAEWFPEIAGFRTFKVPLAQKARL
jgi:hypothetical protein